LLTLDFKFKTDLIYAWPYTKDHAKWAVVLKNSVSSITSFCIADRNCMVSQEKRGGGSLCFQEERLWESLKNAEEKLHLKSQAGAS
jgi:deoxyribonuclease-2